MKRIIVLIILLQVGFIFGANGVNKADKSLNSGQTKKIKVISLAPAITEILYKIKSDNFEIVGRSNACDYPLEAKNLPIYGSFANPNIQRIIRNRPDLVVSNVFQNKSVVETLEKYKIKVVVLPLDMLGDYLHAVDELGDLLDSEEQANAECERFKAVLVAQKEKIRVKKQKVFFLVWDKPLMTVGKKTFINEIIELLGAQNIGDVENRDFFRCQNEWIIKSNPDIIIFPGPAISAENRVFDMPPSWKQIEAVTSGNVILNLNEDLFYRLGPRTTDAIVALDEVITKSLVNYKSAENDEEND